MNNDNFNNENFGVPEYIPTYPKMPEYKSPVSRIEQYNNLKKKSIEDKRILEAKRKKEKVNRTKKAIAVATVSIILLTGAMTIAKKTDIPEKISTKITRIQDTEIASSIANEINERYGYNVHTASDGIHVWYESPIDVFKNIVNIEGEFYNESPEQLETIFRCLYLARGEESFIRTMASICSEKRGSDLGFDVEEMMGDDWESKRHETCELIESYGSFDAYRNSINPQLKGGK